MIKDFMEDFEQMFGKRRAPANETALEKLIRTDGSICADCATDNGAVWPDGHLATSSVGKCGVCGHDDVATCSVSDWNWPNYRGRKAKREF